MLLKTNTMSKLTELSRARIARPDDNCVPEINMPATAIGQPTLVEHLEQQVEHVAMCLLYLVEQHDGVGAATHPFCELSTLIISHITRRRTNEARCVETFGKLGHIHTDERIC